MTSSGPVAQWPSRQSEIRGNRLAVALGRAPAGGCGREGVRRLLQQWLPGADKALQQRDAPNPGQVSLVPGSA